MRFPLSLTRTMTGYLLKKKLSGETLFPLVLMLEPLHACNLQCAGCGRIREYASTMNTRLSLEQCLAAADECGAPVVSVCGGEPLIYPEIGELVERLIAKKKHVYLCTNGVELEKKLSLFKPSSRLFFNVHIDGMEESHDAMAGRRGVFASAVQGLRAAKQAGFQATVNTTIYKQTDMNEILVLFAYLTELNADGMMISPAFDYQAVQNADPSRADEMFMNREEIQKKFRDVEEELNQFRLTASPIYMDFLCGRRELPCAAWANPTFNVRGWRGPCYLRGDSHFASYRDLLDAYDWALLGPDHCRRCDRCMVHCGFEPAAVLRADKGIRDLVKMAVWQMG